MVRKSRLRPLFQKEDAETLRRKDAKENKAANERFYEKLESFIKTGAAD